MNFLTQHFEVDICVIGDQFCPSECPTSILAAVAHDLLAVDFNFSNVNIET